MKNKKIKIAVIGLKGLPAFGGAASVGENIIEELMNEIDFTVLSVSSHASKKINKHRGYKQIVFNKVGNGSINTLIYTVKCMFHCLFNNYDLIHLHHASSGFITPFLRLKYKVVVTFHGVHRYKDPKFSSLHNIFFRFSECLNIKCANEMISVSKPDLDFILKKYNKKIIYIPNGISGNASLKHNFKKNINGSYILFAAARIYEIKGLHLLLLAVKKSEINVEIKIAGDINQSESYKNEIINLSKGLNVSFLGLIKDKTELLDLVANAKLFIFPSIHEAMSMMLLEVASVKTPLVTSDIAANKAIFNDTEVLYFASENVDDLATKINYALANENELRERANNAFEKLEKNFSWKIISEQYEKLFNSLMT